MSEIKIREIRPIRNGVEGLKVTFSKVDKAADNLTYNNEFVGTYKMPVSAELRAKWVECCEHFKTILCLDENYDLDFLKLVMLRCDGADTISGAVKMITTHNKWTSVNIPAIVDSDEYSGYDSLLEIVEEIWSLTSRYVLGEAVAQPKQFMLDLFEDASQRNKDVGFTKQDINLMSNEEAFDRMTEILEKNGAVFLVRAGEEDE